MDIALTAAGSLAVIGAAIHGIGGELLVVRRLSAEMLPSTRFGSPRMTMAMIHAAWHLTTVAFLTVGTGLLLAGTVLDGDAAQAIGLLGAAGATGFALVVLALGGAHIRSPRLALRHPGPAVLVLTAALAWLGAV